MTAVSVTGKHLGMGIPGDCLECPVALAISDAFPDLAYLQVFPASIDIRPRPDDDMIEIEVTGALREFIRAFDRLGGAVSAPVRWAGEPERCGCTRIVVATLEETLACPYGWRLVPGTGWVHTWPPRRQPRAGRVRETAQAAS